MSPLSSLFVSYCRARASKNSEKLARSFPASVSPLAGSLQLAHLGFQIVDQVAQDARVFHEQSVLGTLEIFKKRQDCLRLVDVALLDVGPQRQAEQIASDLKILHVHDLRFGPFLLDLLDDVAGQSG